VLAGVVIQQTGVLAGVVMQQTGVLAGVVVQQEELIRLPVSPKFSNSSFNFFNPYPANVENRVSS
jgi:hypothetical protein